MILTWKESPKSRGVSRGVSERERERNESFGVVLIVFICFDSWRDLVSRYSFEF